MDLVAGSWLRVALGTALRQPQSALRLYTLSVATYVRGLNPRLPRSVWFVELGGVVNAFGNGFVYPFLFIYLHNVRGFALGVSGLIVATNAAVALVSGTTGGAAADRF